ncbi:Oleic acid lipoxygenase [Colletotrichum karsti]|uniref:Manganese lipoxygenase n=1 Tax=Colletotrichum karsti TaxID=1095194 RepID=A0A9P6IAP4_9PEZI|nr:Oleic acid lipoxygenase [Colletotrichum karsti]KAF9875155.1 Oleic acid lipoxygenase [Colletotrichum karsti]
MSASTQSLPNGGPRTPPLSLNDILASNINYDVEEDQMIVWDKGVFLNELQKQGLALHTGSNGVIDGSLAAHSGLKKGTYKGTRLALTEIYSMAEESAAAHFNARGFEPIIPVNRDLKDKQAIYKWSNPEDGYPPHLDTIPLELQQGQPGVGLIFDMAKSGFISTISTTFSFIIPKEIELAGTPFEGPTLADCEKYNHGSPKPQTDIMNGENLGHKSDWYSDFRFAQQHLSGVNPSTITTASAEWVSAYVNEACKQGLDDMKQLLLKGEDLLIQDYSYFREATGVSTDETFESVVYGTDGTVSRYACAPVVLFQLHSDGRLHPLVITIDFKGTLENSVTIFNRRLTPDAKDDIDEKDDWPWRYAKTCAQTADWSRHEIATHLVDTHMIEEAIIVATNRTVPEDHLLYEILSPHWFRTLPLNEAARKLLVPGVIARIAGFGPTNDPKTSRALSLIKWSYKNFNFQDKYIPNDLKKRGFDVEAITGDKYRNYPYATNMYFLWKVIRDFVQSVLATKYKCDDDVQKDSYISDWCKEIQGNGQIPSFPTINTVDQLVDAVTMCIHTASPQHTAVNYLQDYYYSFVPAKPPALCTPLPTDLATLQAITEKELTEALPIGSEGPKWKDWLLAAQLPELLSYKVESRYNLINYAKSLYNVNKSRTNFENENFDCGAIKDAAATFYSRLRALEPVFDWISDHQTEGSTEYKVLQPELTAVSILI